MDDLFGLLGHTLDDKYEVLSLVGEGGHGLVYRGTHCSLRRPVAIKVMKVSAAHDPDERAARMRDFAQEARTLASLDHPALVRVIDFGVSSTPKGPRAPWMVLEWLQGETLADWLRARPGERMSAEACLRWMRPVIEGVGRAHALGVAHRDIKPSNLMCVEGPPPVRLLDFGIAKVCDDPTGPATGETRTGSTRVQYSPRYAAPEQVAGSRTGPWTDVHGLALVLSELRAGVAPYTEVDPMALHLEVLSRERPTPGRRGVDVGAWEPVLARALSLLPQSRYPDASALLAALDEAEGAPATSPRRRRARWVVGATLAAAGAVGAWRITSPSETVTPRAPSSAPSSAVTPRVASSAPSETVTPAVVAPSPAEPPPVAPSTPTASHRGARSVASRRRPDAAAGVTLAPVE